MKLVKNLKLELKKYLLLRKILRIFEAVAVFILFIAFYFSRKTSNEIKGCIGAVLVVPESFLLVKRNEIKTSIRIEKSLANAELDFYTAMKTEFEKMKNDFITQGSKKFVSDECKQLIWKEEMGTGWLSIKVKEFEKKCDENKQIMENLESIKKRLVIF
jgi:hypothetical protein